MTVHPRRFISLRGIVTLSAVTFFAVLLAAVMIQSLRIEGQNHLDKTSEQMAAENIRTLDLRAAIAERESPERIMAKARELDMIDPGPVAPLSSEVAGPAAGQPGGSNSQGTPESQNTPDSRLTSEKSSSGSKTETVDSRP